MHARLVRLNRHTPKRRFVVYYGTHSPSLNELKERLRITTERKATLDKEEKELQKVMEKLSQIKMRRRMLAFEEARLHEAIVETYSYGHEIRALGFDGMKATAAVLSDEESKSKTSANQEVFKKVEKKSNSKTLGTRTTSSTAVVSSSSKSSSSSKPLSKKLKEGWAHAKAELHHYWLGAKLLYANVNTASSLVRLVLKGKSLSRRQYQILVRTGSDIVQLVPTLAFIIIPGAELLLPVALKLFPGMLPSTFEKEEAREEKAKKLLKARVAVASYLQDAVMEIGEQLSKTTKPQIKDSSDKSDSSSSSSGGGDDDEGSGKREKAEVKVSGQQLVDFLERARCCGCECVSV